MILKRETDRGTDVVVPRLDADIDGHVLLALYCDGEQHGAQRHRVGAWPALEAEYLLRGYLPTAETPELAAVIDRATLSVQIAGVAQTKLDNPHDSTDDEPIEPLVIQADDVLIDAGYMRMTDWWVGPNDTLRSRIVPSPKSNIPTEIRYIVRAQLAVAAQHLRDWLAEHGQGDEAIADRLRLSVDPTSVDLAAALNVVMDRAYPAKCFDALTAFRAALRAAEQGDARMAALFSGEVPARLA